MGQVSSPRAFDPADAVRPWWPIRPSITFSLAVGLACFGALFFRDIAAAVDVWNVSTAYSHCYLVLPMALYLLWERKALLEQSVARPEPAWALLALPIALVWLAAERLGIMEGRQLAVIAGVELLMLTVLGWRLFRRISGPLLFLFFLVPFGAFLTPLLQRFTAGFTIVGLDLLGIPNFSDKFIIETPAGTFFVAEACAGLRFLIAAIAFGVFYALLSYTSPRRRAAFIAASIVVPIIANGFRALGIVVLGQILGSAEAAAADHIIYGWVFFSAVMLLLIAAGQMFRESAGAAVTPEPRAPGSQAGLAGYGMLGVVVLMASGPAVGALIDARGAPPALRDGRVLSLPDECRAVAPDQASSGSRSSEINCDGTRFIVDFTVFSPRSTASAMVQERRRVTQEIGAEDVTAASVDVPAGAGNWTLVQTTDPTRTTAYASWVDGHASGGGLAARMAQARDSLFGAAFSPALLTITTTEPSRSAPAARRVTMDRLIALLRAQSGLNERIIDLTRVSSGS